MAVSRTASRAGGESVILQDGEIVEAPTWFGPSERPLFGWFAYPLSRRVRGAVVLCQPIAEESNMAYRTFRTLTQELAREGFLVLRFDYDGTGDSAGQFEDPDRAEAWSESVVHAVAEVREWGVERVSVVGMRLGATLAYMAAANSSLALDELILWDPCLSARSFLRELQLLQKAWMDTEVPDADGWVETPCYRFTTEFAESAQLAAIDGRVPSSALARRTTVLARPDRVRSSKLLAALPLEETAWRDAIGQAELVNVEAVYSVVPRQTLAEVIAQLKHSAPEAKTVITVRLEPTARWTQAGVEMQESAVFLPGESALFAIRTTGAMTETACPKLLFLNIASKRHLGEGRIWVQLARESAANGFESFRLDQSGVGDSATRAGHVDDVVYDEGWIEDVPAVALAMSGGERSNDDASDIIGIGLCSSGTSALQAATRGSFREVIAINVPFDFYLNSKMPPRWTVFTQKSGWFARYDAKHRRRAGLLWTASSVFVPNRDVMSTPREIVMSGTEVTLFCGPEDLQRIRHNPLWSLVWGRALRRSGRFRLTALPTADHSLAAGPGREEAKQAVLERLRVYASAN